jgi:NADH dehydrogenase
MILVVGSTGRVGGMITRSLLARDRRLRVLVRPGSDHQAFLAAGAEAALGDLKDQASLAVACRGVDTVITTASAGERGGDDTPQTVDLAGNRHLIDAARDAGVRQFIFISALLAHPDHPVPVPRAKALTESALRDSGVPYTIIAANAIADVMFPLVVGYPLGVGRPVTLVGEGRRRHTFIAARDVAAFATAAIDHPSALNRRIEIGGPEALSWRDVVAAYERTLGHAIPVQWIPPGELLPDLPPAPGLTQLVSGLMAALETFDTPLDMTEVSQTFGVTPTTIDELLTSLAGSLEREAASSPGKAGPTDNGVFV